MSRKSSRSLWTEHLKHGANTGTVNTLSNPKHADTPPAAKIHFTGTVLGVDPSLRGMGLALIHVKGVGQFELVFSRTLSLGRTLNFYDCLGDIAQEMEHQIEQLRPQHVAVEETIFVQNFRTAQIMGAARGAALAAVTRRKIPVFEYAPLRIKQAVVGYGRASKTQVSGMVRSMLNLDTALTSDESDAAAAAICHAYTYHQV